MIREIKIRRSCETGFAVCSQSPNCKVEPHASYSPSEMQRLSEQGIPISASAVNESLFFDGYDSAPDVPPVEQLRGIDVVQVWESQRDSRSKILSANRRELSILNDTSV